MIEEAENIRVEQRDLSLLLAVCHLGRFGLGAGMVDCRRVQKPALFDKSVLSLIKIV